MGRILNILVVEDERIIGLLNESIIRSLGHKVAGNLATGERAVEFTRSQEVDLIFMDIRLAGIMDGIEAVEHIHAQKHIPVIYISAYADEETQARAARTSHLAFLSKPLEPDRLKQTIDTLSGEEPSPLD